MMNNSIVCSRTIVTYRPPYSGTGTGIDGSYSELLAIFKAFKLPKGKITEVCRMNREM